MNIYNINDFTIITSLITSLSTINSLLLIPNSKFVNDAIINAFNIVKELIILTNNTNSPSVIEIRNTTIDIINNINNIYQKQILTQYSNVNIKINKDNAIKSTSEICKLLLAINTDIVNKSLRATIQTLTKIYLIF
jgi:hypothetical protein